jgi:hypothetical protein
MIWGYFCNYAKKLGISAISAYLRGKNAIFPIFNGQVIRS